MKESTQVQFLYDVKYHDAVIALLTAVNEEGTEMPIFVTQGQFGTYDPASKHLLLHLFEFIFSIPPRPEWIPPADLFERFGKATDNTGLVWLTTIKR